VLETSQATPDAPVFLMLDELVYTDRWDLWLKTFFDDQWPVGIAATSSATAAFRERRLESGAGRWSRADHDLAAWRRLFMLVGGFPELLTAARDRPDEDEPDRLLESQQVLRADAVERAIYKDIPQSFGVDNPMMLERLLYVLAAQITGLLSPSNICSDLGLSQPTFDRYLSTPGEPRGGNAAFAGAPHRSPLAPLARRRARSRPRPVRAPSPSTSSSRSSALKPKRRWTPGWASASSEPPHFPEEATARAGKKRRHRPQPNGSPIRARVHWLLRQPGGRGGT